jgi:hypothetical protein
MASIHIKDYDLCFGSAIDDIEDKINPLLLKCEEAIVFMKVYLMSKY